MNFPTNKYFSMLKVSLLALFSCVALTVAGADSVLVGDLAFEQSGGKPVAEDLLW